MSPSSRNSGVSSEALGSFVEEGGGLHPLKTNQPLVLTFTLIVGLKPQRVKATSREALNNTERGFTDETLPCLPSVVSPNSSPYRGPYPNIVLNMKAFFSSQIE